MPSRRQEKVCRVIKEGVSDIIRKKLNDPRIEGLVSVTEVDVSPDLKNADVYFSILAPDKKIAERTLEAINHAKGYIQTEVGRRMTTKYYPKLTIREDTKLKKTLETLKLIDEAAKELHEKDAQRQQQENENEHGED